MLFYKTIHGLTYLTIHGARTLGAVPESSVIRAWASFRPQYFCIMITVRAICTLVDFVIAGANLIKHYTVEPNTSSCAGLLLIVDEQSGAVEAPKFIFRDDGLVKWNGGVL